MSPSHINTLRILTAVRYIAIIGVLLASTPLLGQKWERLTNKFNKHYEHFQYSESLDDALSALAYSTKRLDSTDIRFMLSYYNVTLAYHALEELDKAKTNIKTAYELMVPFFSHDPEFAKVCELYGRIETELGYHKSAAYLLSNACDIKIQLYGKESYETMRSLYFTADLEMASSQWEQLVTTLEEALGIHERLFQKNQNFARYANYLGLIYMNNGYNQKAALNFNRALSAYWVPVVIKNLTFGHANNNLALIYYSQSDYENAAIHFERADSIYQLLLEGYSENYMMLLNNIASLYYSWNKSDLALEAYQKLEEYLNKNPDGQDLNYIQGVENTAHFYASVGKLGVSEKYYNKAITIRRSGSPIDSLGLARLLQSLATVYAEGSRPDLAAEVAVESFNILMEKSPQGNPELVSLLSFIVESFFDSNQVEKAIYYYQRAHEQIELADTAQFPDDGNNPEARAMFDLAKEIYESKYGKDHPDYANLLIQEISYKISYGDFSDAMLNEIREVERICLKSEVDSTSRLFIDCIRSYSSYYFGTKEYHQALAYGLRLMRLVEMAYGRNSRIYAETTLEQSDSYVMLGDKKNLSLLYEEAYDIASHLDPGEQKALLYFIEKSRLIDQQYLEEDEEAR